MVEQEREAAMPVDTEILESLYIDGLWQPVNRGTALEVQNPANGQILGRIAEAGRDEAVAAADAAGRAFHQWADLPARTRLDLLHRVAALLEGKTERMAYLLAQETGKRLPEAVAEVRFAAEYFRWFAEQGRRPRGELIPNEVAGRRHWTDQQAAGVAVCLTPWNFPVSIQARKLAPALAAGCTTVSRPSEKAPLSVIELFRCLHEAGIPPGVANLVCGPPSEITEALLTHTAVRVVSFTGSTQVGSLVMRLAADRIVRPLLELGGDAPFIVFEDADLERAVEGATVAKFRNNGQSCIAANRFLVQESVYEEFTRLFAKRVGSMSMGDPVHEPIPDLGPVIDAERRAALEAIVAQAESGGARRVTSERSLPSKGSFVVPQLLVDVPEDADLGCREVFGPVCGVFPFTTEEEAVARANGTDMGLAGYVYTKDLARAWRMSEALELGILGLNQSLPSVAFAPMGGVKQSGLGREGGHHGLEEFLQVKYVCAEF
jgi:succinate-semialdehyde dehydrogenase/glutarate-semialdehyde dehydrogenase